MNARRMLGTIVVIASTSAGWATPAAATTEGCVARAGSSCAYRATKSGGIVASGISWQVGIQRSGRWISYGPAYYLDAAKYASRRVNAIRKGDTVYVWTGETASYIAGGCCVSWPPVVDVVAVGPAYNH
jgi:hypothetical protein